MKAMNETAITEISKCVAKENQQLQDLLFSVATFISMRIGILLFTFSDENILLTLIFGFRS